MRKRHHTNQTRHQFSLNGSSSNRSLRGSMQGSRRSISKKLAPKNQDVEKLAKQGNVTSEESMIPLKEWKKEENYEMKLEDEISTNELNDFAFSCIESLANLANSSQSIQQALTEIVKQKLVSFANLAQESREAKGEFREYVAWSKQFISSVQPLLKSQSGPAQEIGQLTTQVMQCAERSMRQKYRSETLTKRLAFLVEAVSNHVSNLGVEMGFPQPVMNKVRLSVSRALTAATK